MKLKKIHKGFTLIEMLIVLLIISVLILLFMPNLADKKKTVNETGNNAIIKVVETQMEMYMLDEGTTAEPALQELVAKEYITSEQAARYNEAKQTNKE